MSDDVKMIYVGGQRVGIIGLQAVFEDLKTQGIQADESVKNELVALVKKKNYIPPSAANDYAVALMDEFKMFLGMTVARKKHLEVRILGSGCMLCDKLEKEVMGVLAELNLPADFEHVRDVAKFKDYGVFGTPALVINGDVKAVGKVPLKGEIKKWIETAAK
jgi:small redox-active disulfide protein 2